MRVYATAGGAAMFVPDEIERKTNQEQCTVNKITQSSLIVDQAQSYSELAPSSSSSSSALWAQQSSDAAVSARKTA